MSAPKRIQRRRIPGWRMPEGAVYVGRPSKWGNPWRVVPVADPRFAWSDAADVLHVDGDRSAGRFVRRSVGELPGATYWAVQMYRLHLGEHPDLFDAAVAELVGRDLACWCPFGQPCHADVLLEIANRPVTP